MLKIIFLLLAMVAVIHVLTMTAEQRQSLTIRTLSRRHGLSQRQIAARLGVTRYRVRKALA